MRESFALSFHGSISSSLGFHLALDLGLILLPYVFNHGHLEPMSTEILKPRSYVSSEVHRSQSFMEVP